MPALDTGPAGEAAEERPDVLLADLPARERAEQRPAAYPDRAARVGPALDDCHRAGVEADRAGAVDLAVQDADRGAAGVNVAWSSS
jgi:hypothetical protein